MSEAGFGGALDLTGADTSGFKVPDDGTYTCRIHDYEWRAVKNEGGKLAVGTPMLSVEFVIDEGGDFDNAHLWTQYPIPPEDYDAEKRAKALGAFARFFVAAGMEESDVKSKKFNANAALDDLIGNYVRVTVKKETKWGTKPEDNEWQANVRGVKAMTEVPVGSGKLT